MNLRFLSARSRVAWSVSVGSLACVLLSGCHIDSHKDGGKDNVDIATPFGSMHVKTNDGGDTTALGLTTYPGSAPVSDSHDHDHNSANVDMSFGNFHLGVKAAALQTHDTQDSVVAFYRKDLTRYGDVIECRGDSAVGSPSRTAQGLTCDSQHGGTVTTDNEGVHVNDTSGELELRAGSPQHQHLVAVRSKDGGTRIRLVMLDLPSHLENHDNKDSE